MPDISPEDVARRLATVPLPAVTEAGLRSALGAAVDNARYWQEPDGEDVLAATAPMQRELRRIADHIGQSRHVDWWSTEVDRDDQWSVGWADTAEATPQEPREQAPLAERLAAWRVRVVEREGIAERERPRDPRANYSGEWWSFPWEARCSARSLDDELPAGVLFVEDSMGWKRAFVRRIAVPTGVEVFEIDGPDAWADLCRRYPLEVTAQKRHDWYRTTGRDRTIFGAIPVVHGRDSRSLERCVSVVVCMVRACNSDTGTACIRRPASRTCWPGRSDAHGWCSTMRCAPGRTRTRPG
ncbi:hypothetical protein [Rhodococcus sp. SJ-3]|uniref:hypothetical protein n=1 Tax=Rhodococcus sp. SJ-3 TaxID=3454628 RepID=UPI003F78DAEE